MWRKPGRTGAILYATRRVVGTGDAVLQQAADRPPTRPARGGRPLPAGPIIVISNHTSYADGVLLALACRRMGRSCGCWRRRGVRCPGARNGRSQARLHQGQSRRGAMRPTSLDEAAAGLAAGEAVGIFPEGRLTRDPMMWPERAKTGAVAWRYEPARRSCRWRWSARIESIGQHKVAPTLLDQRRPPAEGRHPHRCTDRCAQLMNIGPTTEPTVDEVRLAADVVMGRLVAVVAELRGEQHSDPHGVPRPRLTDVRRGATGGCAANNTGRAPGTRFGRLRAGSTRLGW